MSRTIIENIIAIVALSILALIIFGCESVVVTEEGEVVEVERIVELEGETVEVPVPGTYDHSDDIAIRNATFAVIEAIDNCEERWHQNHVGCYVQMNNCIADLQDGTSPGIDCDEQTSQCILEYIRSERDCLVEGIQEAGGCTVVLSDPAQEDPSPNVDTDGDGVDDLAEVLVHSNPCHPCSRGGADVCDADRDDDGDGIANGEDENAANYCVPIYENCQP